MERNGDSSEGIDAVRRLRRLDACTVSDALDREAMANALRAGEPIGAVMGANYEHMLRD